MFIPSVPGFIFTYGTKVVDSILHMVHLLIRMQFDTTKY